MKLAYINFILSNSVIGLEKKIKEQSRCAPDNIDFFLLNRFITDRHGKLNFVKIKGARNYSEYLFRKFSLVEKSINLQEYDYIIMRYPFVDRTSLDFVKKYNVVSEHHSDEIDELKSSLINKSSIHVKLVSFLRLLLEYKYGKTYRENCKGIIAVTDETRCKEIAKIRANIPSITIPNGVDVEAITRTGFRVLRTKNLNMIFVASILHPWHGLKRILVSLDKYKGDFNIKLHIIGDIQNSLLKLPSKVKVINHGVKDGAELDEIFSRGNIGISTMALYVKKLKEAASLKTREYTARGIPFMLAYDDPDLNDVDNNHRFYLKVPNNDGVVDIERVITFTETLSDKYLIPSELSSYMRKYAFEKMDWKHKMKKYVEFCEQLDLNK